jgi:hypothetical protein
MPSGSDYAKRLLEEAHRSFAPHLSSLQEAVQSLRGHLAVSLDQLAPKLEAVETIQLPEADRIIAEVVAEIHAKKEEETELLASFARDLRSLETQEEILNLLLDRAAQLTPRIALFVTRGEQVNGWASRGYSEEITDRIRKCSLSREDSSALRRLLADGEGPFSVDDPSEEKLRDCLGAIPPGAWHFIPMKAMDRPVAILLATDSGEQTSNVPGLRVLAELSVLYLENLALRILQELGAHRAAEPAPQAQAAPLAPPAPEAEVPAIAPPDEEPTQIISTEEEPGPPSVAPKPPEPVIALGPSSPPVDAEVEAMVETIGQPAPALSHAAEAPASMAPVVVIETAPKPAAPKVTEEEKLHNDARRFARLLVSEIKLYNEQKLHEGRANRDIYVRLKRDIDRSREMYERRVPAQVTRKFDYFNDEIVRILAESDPVKLGADYPGPRVESQT